MTLPTCDGFDALIEREVHGACSPSESATLASHLAICGECRSYADEVRRSHRALASIAEGATNRVDWTKLEARLRGANSRRVRRALMLASIGPLAVALAVWGLAPPERRMEAALSATLIVACVVGVRIASDVVRTRRLARLTEPEAFFAAYRADLGREIRRSTTLRWIALTVMAALGIAACHAQPGHTRTAYALLATIIAVLWGRRVFVELPKARRELASLAERSEGALRENEPDGARVSQP